MSITTLPIEDRDDLAPRQSRVWRKFRAHKSAVFGGVIVVFGVILIDKKVWDEIDGYHPALGIYGGGEPYTDIKAQMYGYQVKSHPEMQYYHLAARKRGYHWFQTDMWRNFMITAYSLGGQKYLDMLYAGYYEKCKNHADWLKTLNETRDSAVAAAQADRDHIQTTAKYTVDEVLESWHEYAEIHGHETGEWPT